ncbi:hypothetical protein BDA96_03G219100 [Sorghum bicolor]|uniref:Uncharacterized protein n=2 Tax=Sorghum bicolor TaxID=4558 RepID=A0A1W0VY59_SORBI|nr:uncharacterized protein LOC110433377 isoform X3 [Sorghum bicolor]KAG0538248.1 hypothetical protein BDA96_03G219100 [Sorghum bicolor]OQU87078.1 hypothetical protein SORBI_3003G201750 [Sorghum bicolor]|eukprot:XP_021311009.1 uncharacterized protein LOC110433377 isoform X3 [Sorghum bicolor]
MTKSVHSSFTHMSILHRSSWNSKKKNSRRRKIWMPRGKGVAGATYSMAAILLTKVSSVFRQAAWLNFLIAFSLIIEGVGILSMIDLHGMMRNKMR